MEKYFDEIEYHQCIKNPTSRGLDLWKQWTSISNKHDLHAALRKDLTESLRWIG